VGATRELGGVRLAVDRQYVQSSLMRVRWYAGITWLTILFSMLIPAGYLLASRWMSRQGVAIHLPLEERPWMERLPPVWMAADPGGELLARVGLGDAFLSFSADTPGGPVPLVSLAFGALYDVGLPEAPGEPAPIVGADIQADLFGEAADLDDERAEETIERLLTLAAPLIGDLLSGAANGAGGGGDPGAGGLGGGQGFLASDGAGMVIDMMGGP
jgi:hypothetical protein